MPANYVTPVEISAQLNLQGFEHPALIDLVANAVSRWCDGFCQRHFYPAVGPRFFDAREPGRLTFGEQGVQLDDITLYSDLVEADEVATDDTGDGTYATVWDQGDYQPVPVGGTTTRELRAVGGRGFPVPRPGGRVGLVRITGTWGWPEVPSQVHEACLIQAARVFKRKDSPEGVTGFDQFGVIRIAGRPDPDVAQLLSPLIHPSAATPVA